MGSCPDYRWPNGSPGHGPSTASYRWPNGPPGHGTALARRGTGGTVVLCRVVAPCWHPGPGMALRGRRRAVPCPGARQHGRGGRRPGAEHGEEPRTGWRMTAAAACAGSTAAAGAGGGGGRPGEGMRRQRRRPGAAAGRLAAAAAGAGAGRPAAAAAGGGCGTTCSGGRGRDDLLRSGEAAAVPHRAAAVPSVPSVLEV